MSKRRKARPAKRRKGADEGDHLWCNAQGIWIWRKTHPKTGRRLWRSTGTKAKRIANLRAAEFDLALERELAGLKSVDRWRALLAPLAVAHLEAMEGEVLPSTVKTRRFRLERVLKVLRLHTAADLHDVASLNDELLRYGRLRGIPRGSLRSAYQVPLRQFCKWLAENGRHLDEDPLRNWKPFRRALDEPRVSRRKRRAFLPDEVARALLAADVLDQYHRRAVPQRPAYLALLVTAARQGALISRDVEHLDRRRGRVEFGEGTGNKRHGAGAIDPATTAELVAHVGDRVDGPLLPGPQGHRQNPERLLDRWREAFSLGLLDALWPPDLPWDTELAIQVNLALLGKPRVSSGGNPKQVRAETRQAREDLAVEVREVAALLREEWGPSFRGVDVHSFRKSHRTWAVAKGVRGVVIDKQLGHAPADAESLDVMRAILGSKTGRTYYLDVGSPLFDPAESAQAVRDVLDEAMARLDGSSTHLLVSAEDLPAARARVS